jgi:hypothetical protein
MHTAAWNKASKQLLPQAMDRYNHSIHLLNKEMSTTSSFSCGFQSSQNIYAHWEIFLFGLLYIKILSSSMFALPKGSIKYILMAKHIRKISDAKAGFYPQLDLHFQQNFYPCK